MNKPAHLAEAESFGAQIWTIERKVDEIFPEADIIWVVLDNLNTYALASLFYTRLFR